MKPPAKLTFKAGSTDPDTKLHVRVPDELCTLCSQRYEGECRAFHVPHSEREREARADEVVLCQQKVKCRVCGNRARQPFFARAWLLLNRLIDTGRPFERAFEELLPPHKEALAAYPAEICLACVSDIDDIVAHYQAHGE